MKSGLIPWCFYPSDKSPCKEKKETVKCKDCDVRAWEYQPTKG